MSVIVKTPAANLALTLEDARRHLRLEPEDTSMDEEIASMVASATSMIETDTGLALIKRTVVFYADHIPKSIALPVWPVISVVSVKYADPDEAEEMVAPDAYNLARSGKPRRLIFSNDVVGAGVSEVPGSVEIELEIGHAEAAADVPPDIQAAIKLLLSHFDAHREAVSEGARLRELPLGVDRLIAPYRVHF